jgi:hypothetical protein
MGFTSVVTIDEDLGKSGSGLVERPGFQRLVALVCGGDVGAVFCIEASRLARNGRDWHHLIDLCALVGAVVIDPEDGVPEIWLLGRLLGATRPLPAGVAGGRSTPRPHGVVDLLQIGRPFRLVQ